MTNPKATHEKPETALTEDELDQVAGGGGQPHMTTGPEKLVAVPPGPCLPVDPCTPTELPGSQVLKR